MKLLQLLPIGKLDSGLLHHLATAIPRTLHIACEVLPSVLDPATAFHAERGQYHSSELLDRMQGFVGPRCWRLLGVAGVDLYIPILTFVFGEAQMGGPCAVVSAYRLRQEFYSFPPDTDLLDQRLLKEAIHELGHTCHLTHCDDYSCVMASSHAVEWIDLKNLSLCAACEAQIAVCAQ